MEEQEDELKRQQFHLATFCDDCISDAWPYDVVTPKKLRVEEVHNEYLEYCRLFHLPTPASKVPFGRYIREKYGVQSTPTTETLNNVRTDYRYYPGIFLNKSAKLVYAETKTSFSDNDSAYSSPTDLLQIWCIGNGICKDSPTVPTDKSAL